MDIEKLMQFMGYTASHPEFDDFLHSNGVKKRPKGDESTVWITDTTKTITMEFSATSTYDEEHEAPAKSDGWFVLRAIDVDKQCVEKLPFNLNWSFSHLEVNALLGNPLKVQGDLIGSYYHHGFVVTVRFASKGKKILSFGITCRNKYHKKNLGI